MDGMRKHITNISICFIISFNYVTLCVALRLCMFNLGEKGLIFKLIKKQQIHHIETIVCVLFGANKIVL